MAKRIRRNEFDFVEVKALGAKGTSFRMGANPLLEDNYVFQLIVSDELKKQELKKPVTNPQRDTIHKTTNQRFNKIRLHMPKRSFRKTLTDAIVK